MKIAFQILFLQWSLCVLATDPNAIPQVPSTITIADVKIKITADAQRDIQKDVDALRASEKYFRIKLERVNLYFPLIEKVLKEEGVPEDIKYLAVQESSLVSDAVSSADAVGYWQFKDFTAREVGLRVDGKIDERKNIMASSRGAAKYFKRNNYFVKNWIYAVSAYQAGPAGVKRYLDKKFVGTDKLVVDKKTHWYAKRFIAHVIAFKDEVGKGRADGLKLQTYDKGKNKDLKDIAKELKIETELLEQYNKWLRHGKIPDDKDYYVIVPYKGKVNIPKAKTTKPLTQRDHTPPPLNRTKKTKEPGSETQKFPDQLIEGFSKKNSRVTIKLNDIPAILAKQGDDASDLSKAAKLSIQKFAKINDLLPGEPIKAGALYYTKKKKGKSSVLYHITQPGENLWDISQQYGIKLKSLASKNNLQKTDAIKPGRLIYLKRKLPGEPEYFEIFNPEPTSTIETSNSISLETLKEPAPKNDQDQKAYEVASEPAPLELEPTDVVAKSVTKDIHVVESGETLWGISNQYEVMVSQLMEWNGLRKGEPISPGQKLFIAAPVEVITEAEVNTRLSANKKPKNTKMHKVKAGETLYGISREYGLTVTQLMEWNELSDTSLSLGQELVVKRKHEKDGGPDPSSKVKYKIHTVHGGETLYGIAKKYDMTVTELKQINEKADNSLSVGEELKVIKK